MIHTIDLISVPMDDVALVLKHIRNRVAAQTKVIEEEGDINGDIELNTYELKLIIQCLDYTSASVHTDSIGVTKFLSNQPDLDDTE